MGFAEAFLSQVGKHPKATFLMQGSESISFNEAFNKVKSMQPQESMELALKSNNVTSVIAWLSTELLRESNQSESPVDFVKTSGSTGNPKEFYVSLESQLITARAINESILNNEELDEVIVLPISHSSARGRLRAAVLRGTKIHLASNPFTFRSLDVNDLQQTQFAMAITPTTFRYLEQRLGGEFWSFFSGLKNLEFGSAELRESEQSKLLEDSPQDLELYMHYGLSEASRSFIRNVRKTSWNSLGTPMPHTRYRITNEGQLIISGQHIASQEIKPEGRVKIHEIETGDLCTISRSGEVLLSGRLKNTINCGGYTIHIEQLESSLARDRTLAAIAIGKAKDSLLGEVPVIFVPIGLTRKAFEAWGELEIANKGLMQPIVCETSEIPSLPSGKIDRQTLNYMAFEHYSKLGK
jgi:acyl-CoA synthetase (AMP-forming)/AMP-acid ligase II